MVTLDLSDSFCDLYRVQANLTAYDDTFQIVKAYSCDERGAFVKDTALEQEALKIRYDAYCAEHDFEPDNQFGIESDEYDDRALMSLVRHKPTGKYVATVRFIPPKDGDDFDFPTIRVCEQMCPQLSINSSHCAEISRLCISRARLHDADMSKQEASMVFPALLTASFSVSTDLKVSHWLGCMETPLIKRLKRFYNIDLDWVGDGFEHHGTRSPFITKFDTIDRSLHERHTILRDIIDFEHARGITWGYTSSSLNFGLS